MFNFLSALKYLADNKIVHRDLKPENLILESKGDDHALKIADFGLASYLDPETGTLTLMCGSPGYVAPELLNEKGYDTQADVFSAGVIMYVMLTGRLLFRGNDLDEILDKNRQCVLDFPACVWESISESGRDLIKCMLKADPKERITAAEALEHTWFKKENDNVIKVEKFETQSAAVKTQNNSNPSKPSLLVTATPVMAGRKLQITEPPSPLLPQGRSARDATPVMNHIAIKQNECKKLSLGGGIVMYKP